MNVALHAATYRAPLAPASAAADVEVARIAIFDTFSDAEPAWRQLEGTSGVYSPYQRFDWVALWHRHVSQHRGTSPFLVAGFDTFGEPLFLWPFARDKLGPLNVAIYFGDKHATINMALWRRDFAASLGATDLRAILARVAQEKTGVDLLVLFNQPVRWNGIDNPFALLPHMRAGEDNFCLSMNGSGKEVLAAQLSGSMRSRLAQQGAQLERLQVIATPARQAGRSRPLLDQFFLQKAAKLKASGFRMFSPKPASRLSFAPAATMDWRAEAAGRAALLEGDGELLALFSGLHDGASLRILIPHLERAFAI